MATDYRPRLYLLLKPTPALHEIYNPSALDSLTEYLEWLVGRAPYSMAPELSKSFRAVGAPSKDWAPAFVGDDDPSPVALDSFVVVCEFDSPRHQQEFIDLVSGKHLAPGAEIQQVGVEIGVGSADHWCPSRTTSLMFGRRSDARRTINADALGAEVLCGQNVNVVIIDEGLDKDALKPRNWGGGLNWIGNPVNPVKVGTAKRTSHGMMIARSVLDLAPGAVLYDVPLLPERIASVSGFFSGTSAAQVVFQTILAKVASLRNHRRWAGPWVLVNAWAIFDRSTEIPLGDYTENKAAGGHPLINEIRSAIQGSNFDVIFAAGNCGEFCPSGRCGQVDRGPGHSIWGANALPDVVTAGAVLSDETWVGYSSQGPGPNINGLANDKPDFCAPSDFSESNDAAVRNSGTSTACAVTAGVVAALRSNPAWNQTLVPPAQLRQALIASARQTHGPGWNARLGHGILDAAAAIGKLPP